ncbi:MAG: type IV secretory system conjugative DNA transfer family protein [Bdellovibrionales bacterium]
MNENKNGGMSDRGFAILAVGLVGFIVWLKFKLQIVAFYLKWRYGIAVAITALIMGSYYWIKRKFLERRKPAELEKLVLSPGENEDAVFAGITPEGKSVYIKQSFKRMHTQVVGTTNAGKTESVIIPWAVDDIKKGRGLLMIDGKSDSGLLNKLYAYAKKHHREHDVRILSLCSPEISHTFNPLAGGSVLEVVERVFGALTFENEYFRSIQYDAFLHCLLLLEEAKIKATPYRMIECLKQEKQLLHLRENSKDERLQAWVDDFVSLKREEREQRTSGLIAQLQCFSIGPNASIFNCENSDIDLERALEDGEIVYCQLPALKIPTLGKMTGKLILQCLQSAVSSRHLGSATSRKFFSVYLDDFTEYLTPNFVTLLNKSRSANVGIVFAHQALGDLASLGEGVSNTILTNSNLKVFMRTNEPESAEYFAGVIGTVRSVKVTERQKDGTFGSQKTGDGSVREVEEYKVHPNVFKKELGIGEAVVVLPHETGSLSVRLKFKRTFDLDVPQIPKLLKPMPMGLPKIKDDTPSDQTQPAKETADVVEELSTPQDGKAAA